MKINTKKLTTLLENLHEARGKLNRWEPSDERTALELVSDDLEGEIVDLLKEAGLSRFEFGKFTLALRKTPTFFKVTSMPRLVAALRRHHLTRFLIPEYSVDLRALKEYLLATKKTLPGLSKKENRQSLYVFEKSSENQEDQEFPLELFVAHGVDDNLANPVLHWRQLFADLRYLGGSIYPKLKKGEKRGDWTLPEVKRYFAKIVDALRSVHFPILEKEKDNSSWWQLYRESKELMKSEPPSLEKVSEWDKLRTTALKISEDYEGIYLGSHSLLLYHGDKTAIVNSIKFASHISESLYLFSDRFCFGLIELGEPSEIKDLDTFTVLCKQHHVSNDERKKWWEGKWPLYSYSVKWIEKYPEPVDVKIPYGTQVFISAHNIDFG